MKSNKKHIVSFSGGKDSSAMLLRMIELKMPIDQILFADTGKEFPAMYDHIKKMSNYTEKAIGVPVTILKPKTTWDNWFYGKVTRGKAKGMQRGFPLCYFPCWWSRESKFKTMDPICKGNERYMGIAVDEPNRIKNEEGYNYPLNNWGWTEKDCLEYLIKKGMSIPLHHQFNRTGCWCCIKQPLESIKTLCKEYPDLWEKLKQMESESPKGFKPNIKLIDIEKEIKEDVSCEI